jgi:hypothetical protein
MDDLEERASLMEYDGNMPRHWAESFARLCCAGKPDLYDQETWGVIVDDACALSRHIPALDRNCLSIGDVRALLPHIKGRPVTAIGMGDVTIEQSGATVKLYRRPRADGRVYWTEGRRA